MNIIKQIALDYNLNTKALKYYIKEKGLKQKQSTRLQILEIIYINAPELFYCRADEEKGTVEYLDINLNIKLCYEIKLLRKLDEVLL